MSSHTFNPPGHELIQRYLNRKITETDNLEEESHINEVIMCRTEPTEIPGLTRMSSTQTWHVISRVMRLNGKKKRVDRSSKTGHWKISGKKYGVKDLNGNIIGFKTYLRFKEKEKSSSSSSSTGNNIHKWTMHEFHSFIDHPNKDDFVLCKLIRKLRNPPSNAYVIATPAPQAATDLPLVSAPNHIIIHPEYNITVDDYVIEDGDAIFSELEDINTDANCTQQINWEEVNEFLKQYIP